MDEVSGCRVEYTWRPPLLAVWDSEEEDYMASRATVCMARWRSGGRSYRAGDLCGGEVFKMVGDVGLCDHHYGRAQKWVWEQEGEERRNLDRDAADLERRRKKLDAELARQEKRRREAVQAARKAASLIYYVRRTSDGLIKIGTTSDIGKRMAALEREHGELQLLHAHPGGRDVEQEMHAEFSVWRASGEWFHPGRDLVRWLRLERGTRQTLRISGMVSIGTLHEVTKGALSVPPPARYIPPKPRTRYALKS